MSKVLIADDNKQIISILSEYAKKEGFTPIPAYDGLEAHRLFESEKPDIVLLNSIERIGFYGEKDRYDCGNGGISS